MSEQTSPQKPDKASGKADGSRGTCAASSEASGQPELVSGCIRPAPPNGHQTESPSPELLARRDQKLAVYVGPDRPFSLPLRTNAILRGEPLPQLEAVLAGHPDMRKLFVPVEALAETRLQLRKEGSVMQRLFNDINEASRKARKAKE